MYNLVLSNVLGTWIDGGSHSGTLDGDGGLLYPLPVVPGVPEDGED